MTYSKSIVLSLSVVSMLLVNPGCFSRGQELADRGDELLYQQRFAEAARQFELVLHECGDKTGDRTKALKISTLRKIADLKQFYLHDPEGALRTYRMIVVLSPDGEAGFNASMNVVKLMRSRSLEPVTIVAEIERLMTRFPSRANIPKLNLQLAEIAFRSARYKDVEKHVRSAQEAKDSNIRVEAGMLLASAQEMEANIPAALKTYEALQAEVGLQENLRTQIKVSIAHCYERMGQLDRARTLYAELEPVSQNPAFIRNRIVRLEHQLNKQKPEIKPRRGRRLRSQTRTVGR